MSDLADVGIRFANEGYDAAARQADNYTEKTDKAEKATDKLGTSQKRLSADQMGLSGALGGATGAIIRQAEAAITLARQLQVATGMTTGLRGALVGLTGAAIGLLAALTPLLILATISAVVSYFSQSARDAEAAVKSLSVGIADAERVIDRTQKVLDRAAAATLGVGSEATGATPRIAEFAGQVGWAAEKLWDMAAASKAAAINSLLAERATLGATLDDAKGRTTGGAWKRLQEDNNPLTAWRPAVDWTVSLFQGGTQKDLQREIGLTEGQIGALEKRIRELDAVDMTAWLDKTSSGLKKVGAAAKEAKAGVDTFVSADYMQAWRELQEKRNAPVALTIPTKLDLTGITSQLPVLDERFEDASNTFRDQFLDAAHDVSREFDRVFDDFGRKDWMSAFSGLFSAVETFQGMWNSGQKGSKVGAVAGLANAAGQAIGGKAGAGLMGAAGGAAAGLALTTAAASGGLGAGAALLAATGPVGWVIGGAAVIGGLLGLFGDSKAKKRQKEEERARAAADAATLAQQTLNQQNEIAIQTMLLLNDAQGARNLQLQVERAGIAASNLEAFDAMVKLRDENELRELRIQLLEAQGQVEQANAMREADALGKLTPAAQELTKQIWAAQKAAVAAADAQAIYNQQLADADAAIAKAQQDLTAARNAETQQMREQAQQAGQTAQATRDTWKGFYDGLAQFQDSIGGEMAGSSLGSASARFFSNATRAQLGDKDAQAQFVALGQDFAQSSAANAVSQIAHLRNLASIKAATEAAKLTAGRQVDIAQAQLDAANAQLAALETVNNSVLTVAEATANLAAALAAKAALTGASAAGGGGGPPTGSVYDSASDSWVGGGTSKADIDRAHAAGIGVSGPAGDSAALLIEMYRAGQFDHLRDADGNPTGVAAQLKAAGFATGGSFEVGGVGGRDSKAFRLDLTPGEMVNVSRPGEMADLVSEVRSMRQEMAAMRLAQDKTAVNTAKTADNTKSTADTLDNVTDGGEGMRLAS